MWQAQRCWRKLRQSEGSWHHKPERNHCCLGQNNWRTSEQCSGLVRCKKWSSGPQTPFYVWSKLSQVKIPLLRFFLTLPYTFREKCGLPIATYFSATKLVWLMDNVPEVKKAAAEDRLMFGTVDTWLVWNLTGGVNGGHHLTDVTNASRTMLMNINTLDWDNTLVEFFDLSHSILPKIQASSSDYGSLVSGSLAGKRILGVVGDQQAALLGQGCVTKGEAKNTYGTGCFMLYNTGEAKCFLSERLILSNQELTSSTQHMVFLQL